MEERLELDEAGRFVKVRIGAQVDSLALHNPSGRAVDEVELGQRLAALPGIERVRRVIVDADSHVRNLRFVEALPHLTQLVLHGGRLETLDGLAHFRGTSLTIDTGRNKKRDLSALGDAAIEQLALELGRREDLDAVAGCASLRALILGHAPLGELDRLAPLALEQVGLGAGRGESLDVSAFGRADQLQLGQCRTLTRLTGSCPATVLVIQTCNQLDLATLRCLPAIERLELLGRKRPVPLSTFATLRKLEVVSLNDCPIELDQAALGLPRLRELSIPRLRSGQREAIRAANPDVVVSDT
jgi:hypothetical protein